MSIANTGAMLQVPHQVDRILRMLTNHASLQDISSVLAGLATDALPEAATAVLTMTEDQGQSPIGGSGAAAADLMAIGTIPSPTPPDAAAHTRETLTWCRDTPTRLDPAFLEWIRHWELDWGIVKPLVFPHSSQAVGTLSLYFSRHPASVRDVHEALDNLEPLFVLALEKCLVDRERPLFRQKNRILAGLADGAPLSWVMERVARTIESQIPSAKCAILRWEPGVVRFRMCAASTVPEAYRLYTETWYRQHRQPLSTAMSKGHEIVCPDIATDPLWTGLRGPALEADIRSSYMYPVLSADGEAVAAIACYFDEAFRPTRRQRALVRRGAQLLQVALLLERMRSNNRQGLAGLSHELRNQLGIIELVSETLQRQAVKADHENQSTSHAPVQEILNTLNNHIALQTRLVEDLLDISRMEGGQLRLRREPLQLSGVLHEQVEALRDHTNRLGVHLDSVLDSDVWVYGDVDRVRQIAVNLLQNALKFTPSGGSIRVRLRIDRHTAVLEVEDTGVGFDPEFASSLFSWFAQGASSPIHHVSTANTGLGLAIVHELVVQHGGQIFAHSPGPGHGCTITVELPLIARPPSPTSLPRLP